MSMKLNEETEIEDVISLWKGNLFDIKKELSELQRERKSFTERRDALKKKIEPISLSDFFNIKTELDTEENREIFQLVYDIHNLELKSFELNEKLQVFDIEKEVKNIIKAFQTVEKISSHLSSWFRELKCFKQETDCVVDYIKFISEKNELQFTILYKGVALMITIKEIIIEESILPTYKVKSDMYIKNLSEKASALLQEKLPVENLLTFIKSEMEEDILPFITCCDISS